jgi:hypothetical protein
VHLRNLKISVSVCPLRIWHCTLVLFSITQYDTTCHYQIIYLLRIEAQKVLVGVREDEEFFYIYFVLIFENKWSNQKISRNVHPASYPTAPWVPAAVGHDVRGGANGRLYCPVEIPAVVGHHGRNPSAVVQSGRRPSAVPHSGSVLAPWGTAASPRLYKRPTPCCWPLPHSSLIPSNLRLSTLQSSSDWGMFLNLVQFS